MKKLYLPTALFILINTLATSCKKENGPAPQAPPETWQEHWYDHNQLLKQNSYDNSVVVYYDDAMPASVTWPAPYLKKVWNYCQQVYGNLNGNSADKRLYAIFHTGKYGGGHAAYYYSTSHDNRNVIDCGLTEWKGATGVELDIVTHEVSHIVESTTFNTQKSPAYNTIWKDSKWAEIFIYDVYKNLKMDSEATRWYNQMMVNTDNFPAANSQWFKNWFYPIYTKYGGSAVLAKYFKTVSDNFPKDANGAYLRDLNWGEFIHFWSGAAGVSLKAQAATAFGWPATWETQFNKAKTDFPNVRY